MIGKNEKEPIWSVPVAVDDIPDTGSHLEIEAPAQTRAEIAKVADLRDLPQLAAVFDLTKQGESVAVTGQVAARVGQTCVVTLEPIENDIEEAVDLVFAPLAAGASAAPPAVRVRSKTGDPPEPLVDGTIDLGAIATEFLILGINPYPRKAGAKFDAPRGDDGGPHPFAALEALKKHPGPKPS
jgi:uncharacterized metal-binding protein YceD (DUF177 family)